MFVAWTLCPRYLFLKGFEMKLSKVATRLKRNRPKWRIALGKGIKPRFFKRHEPEITKVWSNHLFKPY